MYETFVTHLLDDLKVYPHAKIVHRMGYHAMNQRIDHDCFLSIFP